jgi:hypothetical protein
MSDRTYYVTMPATMALHIVVEAESEEAAKEKAFALSFKVNVEVEDDADGGVEISRFETHEHIVKGNVFYGVIREIEVEVDPST